MAFEPSRPVESEKQLAVDAAQEIDGSNQA